jgi:FkbM family methyltransferase
MRPLQVHTDSIQTLKSAGFSPTHILDIGANIGDWTRSIRQIFPQASVLMVEANEARRKKWTDLMRPDTRVRGVNAVLADEERDVTWFMTKGGTGDSIFAEDTRHQHHNETRHAVTLDGLLARESPGSTHALMKLDVQGAELSVLRGGLGALSRAEVVLMEMPLAGAYNRGAPSFADGISFLDAHGFSPFDIPEYHRFVSKRGGVASSFMLQVDVVFVRKGSRFLREVQTGIANFGPGRGSGSMLTGSTYAAPNPK